jgi:hypothetical protein
MLKKTEITPTYLLRINWQKVKEWSIRVGAIVALVTALTSLINGFISFLGARVLESVHTDVQNLGQTVRTVTDTNIPFLRENVNAIKQSQDRHDLEDSEKFKYIQKRLDDVVTKQDLETQTKLIIEALKK